MKMMKKKTKKTAKFKYLEKTADGKFQAFGKSLEEAFSSSALAMFGLMCDTNKVKPKIKKEIKVQGKDLGALLYNFLEELLFLHDSKNFLLSKTSKIKIVKDKEYQLVASVIGDTKGETFGDVKAVTYNEMFIKKQGDKFICQVVVDL